MPQTDEHMAKMRDALAQKRIAASATEVFIAQNPNDAQTRTEEMPLSDGELQAFNEASAQATEYQVKRTVERTAPGTVVMYRPTGTWGYVPQLVSTNAIRQLIGVGWLPQCGDCGREDCGVLDGGRVSGNPNLCVGKEAVKYARCPVCEKTVFDLDTTTSRGGSGMEDPNRVDIPSYSTLTPAQRIKTRMDAHLLNSHQTESAAYGLKRESVIAAMQGTVT